jgi:hypothetical protein
MKPSKPSSPAGKPRKGPGFLEAIVALSILVSLSGVVMPAVGEQVVEARTNRAHADMLEISAGLAHYSNDTRFLPTGVQGRTNVAWLYGPGVIPAGHEFGTGGEARALDDALLNASFGGEAWNGPYVAHLEPDPWGHAYLVNVEGWINQREHAIVVSAGPDGIVETAPDDTHPAGDDLVYRMD